MTIDKKHKGARNELAAVCWLLDQGYEVFRNVSQHGPVDLIATRNGEIHFFDVKSTPRDLASANQIALGIKILAPVGDGFLIINPSLRDDNFVECKFCGGSFNSVGSQRKKKKFCSYRCRESYHTQASRLKRLVDAV
jgi:hypothetical protein